MIDIKNKKPDDLPFWSNRGLPDWPLHFGLVRTKEKEMSEIIHDNYIQTYTGKHFYLVNPTEDSICIEDIAHALSMTCRFAGHINKFYSVAEHSVYVSELCNKENRLAGLLHDASEAYIADIASPFKPFLKNYKELEAGIMKVIAKKFGFEFPLNDDIIQSDVAQLKTEAKALLNNRPDWAYEARYDTPNKGSGVSPIGLSPERAESMFLGTFMYYTTGKAIYA